MKFRKWLIFLGIFLIILFFAVGVPVIINECYRTGQGYLTFWGAADALGYYGNILGASVTILTVWATISFTRKQIKRESYVKEMKGKWDRIEKAFSDILSDINPTVAMESTIPCKSSDAQEAVVILQLYQRKCNMATDILLSILSKADYCKVKDLLSQVTSASRVFVEVTQKSVTAYGILRNFNARNMATETIKKSKLNPNSVSKEDVEFCTMILDSTAGLTHEDIIMDILNAATEINNQYIALYKPLLQLKRETFDEIHEEIQAQANEILCFWRKK